MQGFYTEAAISDGHVEAADPPRSFRQDDSGKAERRFSTTKPSDHDLTQFLTEVNAERVANSLAPMEFNARYSDTWLGNLVSWLFFLGLIVVFWVFILRRMGGPGQQVLNIGKNKIGRAHV